MRRPRNRCVDDLFVTPTGACIAFLFRSTFRAHLKTASSMHKQANGCVLTHSRMAIRSRKRVGFHLNGNKPSVSFVFFCLLSVHPREPEKGFCACDLINQPIHTYTHTHTTIHATCALRTQQRAPPTQMSRRCAASIARWCRLPGRSRAELARRFDCAASTAWRSAAGTRIALLADSCSSIETRAATRHTRPRTPAPTSRGTAASSQTPDGFVGTRRATQTKPVSSHHRKRDRFTRFEPRALLYT